MSTDKSGTAKNAQELFLFLESLGEDLRSRLPLELMVHDDEDDCEEGESSLEAIEDVEDGAVIQMFRISKREDQSWRKERS